MSLFLVQSLLVLVMLAAWRSRDDRRHSSRAAHPSVPEPVSAPAPAPSPPTVPRRPIAVHLVFVEVDDGKAVLDCSVAEDADLVTAGEVFTVAVGLPRGVEQGIAGLFDRWAAEAVVVALSLTSGDRGPRVRLLAEEARIDLELLAASRLRPR